MKRFQLGSLIVLLLSILAACGRSESPAVVQSNAPGAPTALPRQTQTELLTAVPPESPTVFQLKLKPGETYRTMVTMEQTIEQSVLGQVQSTTATTQMTLRYTVRSVDADGTMHVDAVYEQVSLAQEAPAGAVKYDSANPSANQNVAEVAPVFDKMIGQNISIQFAPSGEIKDSAGLDAVIDTIMPAAPEGSLRDLFRQSLLVMFEQSMTGSAGNLAFFPAQTLSTGDSWTQTTSKPINFFSHAIGGVIFNIARETTYTLNERKDGIATIDATAVGSLLPSESNAMMGMKNFAMPGGQIGTLYVDEATGWTIRSEIQQGFIGSIDFGQPGSDAVSMTTPMTVTTLITTAPKP